MKTLILLIVIAFLVSGIKTSKAHYKPLVLENMAWFIHEHWMFPFGMKKEFWRPVIYGATNLNGKVYKKAYSHNCGMILPPLYMQVHSG